MLSLNKTDEAIWKSSLSKRIPLLTNPLFLINFFMTTFVRISKMRTPPPPIFFFGGEETMTSKPYVLMLKLTDKVDLRWVGKVLLYQILVFIIHGKT